MAIVTYPLNNIEYYAEDAELFHVTRTSGVYAKNSFDYSVTGADNNIVIGTGIGWIKNSEFSGKVIAQKEAISLDMGLPDSVYPRIDAIVIQFDSNRNETNIVVKKGTPQTSPVIPDIVQTEALYELYICSVYRKAGSAYITNADIIDLRLSPQYCGLMADSITKIDTDAIYEQISALIEKLEEKISGVESGTEFMLKSVYDTNGNGVVDNAERVKGDVLWENASPTSRFAEQYVTLADECVNCNKFEYYFNADLEAERGYATFTVYLDEGQTYTYGYASYVHYDGSTWRTYRRFFDIDLTPDSEHYKTALFGHGYATGYRNSVTMVPIKIIGYKI